MGHRQRSWHRLWCRFEPLEPRQLLSASEVATPHIVSPNSTARPFVAGSTTPIGLTPAQIRGAYGFDSIINNTSRSITFGGVKADGAGQTIAIVDAFDNPNIKASLAAFDKQFGIADPGNNAFKIVDQTGSTTLPAPDAGWATEIALDVEWVHAMAPGANILLVESLSDNMTDLIAAVDYARGQNGVVAVCCSWGGPEDPTEATNDTIFTSPGGRGVTFVVAAGDDGAPAQYPSASPNVLSVAGTALAVNNNNYGSETVWNDGAVIAGVGGLGISGGGASLYERAPTFQKSIGQKMRGTPDVAATAGGNGFAVYDSFNNTRTGGWYTTGIVGTSGAAPIWAALIAVADQGRARLGKGSLANAQAALYSLPRTDFHDIISGSNGQDLAKPGYDLASGLGSPRANLVIPALVAWNGSTTLPTVTAPASSTTTPGSWWWTKYFAHSGGASASASSGTDTAVTVAHAVTVAADVDSTDHGRLVRPVGGTEQLASSNIASDALTQVMLDSQDREASLPHRIGLAKHATHVNVGAIDSVFGDYNPAEFS